jgi:hypothetical protein
MLLSQRLLQLLNDSLLTLQIRSGQEFGDTNHPSAPVFCIWMLAFASYRLRSKFDIPYSTRGLGYLDAILS